MCSITIVWFFFFKHKTAYELRISDWSSDVCSSDLVQHGDGAQALVDLARLGHQRRNLVKRPHVEAARLHRHQQRVSHGERGAQRAGITAAHVNDNIVLFGRELADLAAQRRAGERKGGIASLPKSTGAQLGKGEGGPLLVAVHQQEVAARKRARHREVDGKGRLADPALSVSDCQYHSALAPLALWLRRSMVCNAEAYKFDWGVYSPSSPP